MAKKKRAFRKRDSKLKKGQVKSLGHKRTPSVRSTQEMKDRRYIAFIKENRPTTKTNRLLKGNTSRCQTTLGGTRVWLKGERRNGDEYVFPVIIDGERCPNTAVTTKRRNGKNIHMCGEHIGIEWIDEQGEVHRYG